MEVQVTLHKVGDMSVNLKQEKKNETSKSRVEHGKIDGMREIG
jgi:hypothetical protein